MYFQFKLYLKKKTQLSWVAILYVPHNTLVFVQQPCAAHLRLCFFSHYFIAWLITKVLVQNQYSRKTEHF